MLQVIDLPVKITLSLAELFLSVGELLQQVRNHFIIIHTLLITLLGAHFNNSRYYYKYQMLLLSFLFSVRILSASTGGNWPSSWILPLHLNTNIDLNAFSYSNVSSLLFRRESPFYFNFSWFISTNNFPLKNLLKNITMKALPISLIKFFMKIPLRSSPSIVVFTGLALITSDKYAFSYIVSFGWISRGVISY